MAANVVCQPHKRIPLVLIERHRANALAHGGFGFGHMALQRDQRAHGVGFLAAFDGRAIRVRRGAEADCLHTTAIVVAGVAVAFIARDEG